MGFALGRPRGQGLGQDPRALASPRPPTAATSRKRPLPATSPPMFRPPCGPVLGWTDGDVVRATGIPYATADRFQPPVPAPDWAEVLAATSWSPACPQPPTPLLDSVLGNQLEHLPRDEHCQHLSVTLPRDVALGEALP